jgi:catechol 2,3-dioxygenase-like lactoylglutathione lyase family enzyme
MNAKPVWTHITIQVSDVDRSIAFYSAWCGLTVVRDRRIAGGNTVWLGADTNSDEKRDLLLVLDPEPVTERMRHFGFQLPTLKDLKAYEQLAISEGILTAPITHLGGVLGDYIMITDPDGHDIEFTVGQPIRGLQ